MNSRLCQGMVNDRRSVPNHSDYPPNLRKLIGIAKAEKSQGKGGKNKRLANDRSIARIHMAKEQA